MRFTKTILSIAIFALASTTQAQTSNLPPLIDRELFFGPPVIAGGQLSPDGKYMSFLKTYKGTMNVWVKDASAPFASAHPLTAIRCDLSGVIFGREMENIFCMFRTKGVTKILMLMQ